MARTKFRWSQLPLREAIAYFSEKRNVDTDSWRDISGAEQDAAFVVAGAKGALLEDFRREVDKAIAAGTPLREFQQQFDQIVARRGWDYTGGRDWRSQLIWETNLRASYGQGREIQIERVKSRRPYAMWRHGGSAQPRPEHIANDGRVYLVERRPTALPHGYGCRCQWFTLSQRDMDRRGLSLSDELPVPVEQGWEQRLGPRSSADRARLLAQVTGRMSPGIARQVANEVVSGEPAAEVEPPTYTDYINRGREFASELDGVRGYEKQNQAMQALRQRLIDRTPAAAVADRVSQITFEPQGITRKEASEFREDITEFARITGGKLGPLKKIGRSDDRAFAKRTGFINAGIRYNSATSRRRVLFHEMGHHVEFGDKNLLQENKNWVVSKATGPLTPLSELTGLDYPPSERALPDDFVDPYVGKLYTFATEVESVGLEHFVNGFSMAELYRDDPDHFFLVLGTIL